EAKANRPLTCGAPRNGLAQAGTRREYVHVASSSTSMSPTVPSRARPFHDAEPSAWVDASAATGPWAYAGKVVRFGEIKEEAGPQARPGDIRQSGPPFQRKHAKDLRAQGALLRVEEEFDDVVGEAAAEFGGDDAVVLGF